MIFFDIETEPLTAEELLQRQPKFEARANIKDPEKIEADIAAKRKSWRDKAALDPYSGRVIAIGCAQDDSEIRCDHYNGTPERERDIIDDFWEFYRNESSHIFCGFNIISFDLPFLIRRSFYLGLQIPKDVNGVFQFAQTGGRRMSQRFLDLMDFWKLGNFQDRISLSNFAVHCGFKPKDGSGKDFAGLLRTDNKEAIRYLKNDVALVRSIYNRCLGL